MFKKYRHVLGTWQFASVLALFLVALVFIGLYCQPENGPAVVDTAEVIGEPGYAANLH